MIIIFVILILAFSDVEILFDELSSRHQMYNYTIFDSLSTVVNKSQNGYCSTNKIQSSDEIWCQKNNYIKVSQSECNYGFTLPVLKPFFKVYLFIDLLFKENQVDSTQQYYFIQLNGEEIKHSDYVFNGIFDCGNSFQYEQKTFMYVNEATATNQIKILIGASNSGYVGFRDLQIFIETCHFSCKTCSGNQDTDCLTCYNGSPDLLGICPPCPENYLFLDIKQGSCVQQCERSGYLSNSQHLCQVNSNIKNLYDYLIADNFTAINQFHIVNDYSSTSISQVSFECSGIQRRIAGFLKNDQGVELALNIDYKTFFFRFRVSFYYENWEDYSGILIYANDQFVSRLYTLDGQFKSDNLELIYSNIDCKFIRIETLIPIENTSVQPFKLRMFGNMKQNIILFCLSSTAQSTQQWGFKNVTIDQGTCSENCYACISQDECTSCNVYYSLYRGQCIQECPIHSKQSSQTCIDLEDLITNSQYLIKAFYNRLQQYTDLSDQIGEFYSEGTNFQTTIDGSVKKIFFSYLATKRILGGPLVWNKGYFIKKFDNLNPHYQIQLVLTMIVGENMLGDLKISFDDANVDIEVSQAAQNNILGSWKAEKILNITKNLNHVMDSLTIKLNCQTQNQNVDTFCAISDYFLVINYCYPYCLKCNGTNQNDCETWPNPIPTEINSENNFQCSQGYFLDKTIKPNICSKCLLLGCLVCKNKNQCSECDISRNFIILNFHCVCQQNNFLNGQSCIACHSTCKTCFGSQSNQCLSCFQSNNRVLDVTICKCRQNYLESNKQCVACPKEFTESNDQCSNNNDPTIISYPGCISCRYNSDTSCNQFIITCLNCDESKGFYLKDKSCIKCISNQFFDGMNCQDCKQGCLTCQNQNNCLTCADGYYYSNILSNCAQCSSNCKSCEASAQFCISCLDINTYLLNNTCKCIDGYYETIDYKCEQCNKPCQTCFNQSINCLSCLSIKFTLYQGICQCPYGFIEQNYDCIQCQQPCLTCINNIFQCLSCIDGYYITQLQNCEICIPPCYTCKQTQSYCLSCISNIFEFYEDSGSCLCPNGYIEINNDCKQCQLPCLLCIINVDNCLLCNSENIDEQILINQQKCQCINGYQMNQQFICEQIIQIDQQISVSEDQEQNIKNSDNQNTQIELIELIKQSEIVCGDNSILWQNKCLSLCGNGILDQQYEECDDGNILGGDGCSVDCLEEESWQCINTPYGLSYCSFILPPSFQLNLISQQKNQEQIVKLTFNQKVKLIQNISIENFIEISIQPETQYQLSYTPINEANLTLQDVIYYIYVKFTQSIDNPIMIFNFTLNNIVNQYDLSLISLQQQISLGQPFILSNQQQQKVNTTIEMNQYMLYSMGGVSGVALLTGNYFIFFGMLDLLQQLSYLQFTSFIKPPHLTQFLQVFSKISLKPLLDSLKLDYYIAKLNGGKLPFISTNNNKNISTINSINAYYLINAKSCYLTLLTTFIVYLFCSWLTNSNLIKSATNALQISQMKLKQKDKWYKLLFKIRWACQQQKMLYFYSGLLQAFQSIEHQLIFSAFLQFPNYSFNSYFDCFNSLAAIFGLVAPLVIGFIVVSKAKTDNSKLLKWDYFFQGIKSQYWSVMQKSIQIIKIMVYLGSIVFLNNYPETQSLALSITSAFYTIYLIRYQPYSSRFEQIKFMIREICFLAATGSFLAYSFNLSDEWFNIFGWIHIGLFTSILAINLLMDLSKQIHDFYQAYLKSLQKALLAKEKMYKFNDLQQFVMVQLQKPKPRLGFLNNYK